MSLEPNFPFNEYDDTGQGDPLVLMPGGLTGWLSWMPHAEALAVQRRVIRVQLQGVALGLVDKPLPADYSVTYEVAALGATLNALGIERADFAAWSYGAAVTLSYAIHHPERVRTLTLIEPPAFWVLRDRGPLPESARRLQAHLQPLASADVTEDQLIEFARLVSLLPEGVDPRTLSQWPLWLQHRYSLRSQGSVFTHIDSLQLLRAFDRPVLLVRGEGTSEFLDAVTDTLIEELRDVRVLTFPGGHAPHLVSMQPFLESFRRFLADPHQPL